MDRNLLPCGAAEPKPSPSGTDNRLFAEIEQQVKMDNQATRVAALRLFGYSFLILFIELALIRYIAGYVRVFGFYLNLVLIATFLGMGVGLLRSKQAHQIRWLAIPAAIALFALVKYFANIVVEAPFDPDDHVWGVFFEIAPTVRRVGILPTVSILFAVCALVFVPLGALLGKEFRKLKPLSAYSVDIGGSLLGIAAFASLSAMGTPPVIWFSLGFALWAILSLPDTRYFLALTGITVAVSALSLWTAGSIPETWSPYYRINVFGSGENRATVHVNGSMHQWILNLGDSVAGDDVSLREAKADYELPYLWIDRMDTVLVVGAGTGNDLALLLEMGVSHIDAVEIDPSIQELGRQRHFQNPYGDPRVHAHVNDARAFLRTTKQKYDVIVFGTLDSQTLLSGMTSLRLDNYVYTLESIQSARDRLKEDGSLIMYHMSGQPYIASKIAGLLNEAFGKPPTVVYDESWQLFNYTFMAGAAADSLGIPVEIAADAAEIPRDDWPYLYISGRTIPRHYLEALGMVLVLSLLFIRIGGGNTITGGFDWTMFFMGVAFLLVETKSIAEMSLLFGSTWTVNLLVFSSILVMILMANLVIASRKNVPLGGLFLGLFLTIGVAYSVPIRVLLPLGTIGQWLGGGLIVAGPIFFAAMIFATIFRDRIDATSALAANLLGAIFGGVLEYSSLVFGIKGLYLLAALAYAGAFLTVVRNTSVKQDSLNIGMTQTTATEGST